MQSLESYISRIKTLPAGPRVLSEVLKLLRQPDLDSRDLIQAISFDPGLTTKMLQRCNLAIYAFSSRAYSLEEAVFRLGLNEMYRVAATVVAESVLASPQKGYGLAAGQLWEHSAATAMAAKLLARFCSADENLLFTAALLHDVGKLVLSSFLEEKYEDLVKETEGSGLSLLEAEKTILGADHAELGGRVLQEWNFPESLVAGIRWHHQPLEAGPYEHLAAAVHVSDLVAHCAGHAEGYQPFAVRAEDAPALSLGLDARDIEMLVLETESALEETKGVSHAA